jgi:hypothetical protein
MVEAIDGDIKFIHASVSGGVMISSVREKYYRKKNSNQSCAISATSLDHQKSTSKKTCNST